MGVLSHLTPESPHPSRTLRADPARLDGVGGDGSPSEGLDRSRDAAGRGGPRRPWWGNPFVWLGTSAVFLLLGLFVAPHFLGGTVIFLPFLWIFRRKPLRGPGPGGRD